MSRTRTRRASRTRSLSARLARLDPTEPSLVRLGHLCNSLSSSFCVLLLTLCACGEPRAARGREERRARRKNARERRRLLTSLPPAQRGARRGARRSLRSLHRTSQSKDEPLRACARDLLRRPPSRARALPQLASLSPPGPRIGLSLALLERLMTTAGALLSASISPARGERSNSHQSPAPRRLLSPPSRYQTPGPGFAGLTGYRPSTLHAALARALLSLAVVGARPAGAARSPPEVADSPCSKVVSLLLWWSEEIWRRSGLGEPSGAFRVSPRRIRGQRER